MRRLSPDKISDALRDAGKQALADAPEADALLVITLWTANLNYPAGFVIARGEQPTLTMLETINAMRQLRKYADHLEDLVLQQLLEMGMKNEQASRTDGNATNPTTDN